MKHLIHTIQATSGPRAWLDAVEHLMDCPGRQRYNLSLAIETPFDMTPADFLIHDRVDAFLRGCDEMPPVSVAGTIFPANHYSRDGVDGVYEDFPNTVSRLEPHSWGTYAMRMLRREGKEGTINPLEQLVEKLKNHQQKNRRAYEINLADADDDAFELPLYRTKDDYKRLIPQPCLSHLTFKVYPGNALTLVAMYRSHYYLTKALGNLIGLAQLQFFVANEAGLEVGPLICHSTYARIDTEKKVHLAGVRTLISECRNDLAAQAAGAGAGPHG